MLALIFLLQACLSIQPILMKDMEVLSFYSDGYTGTMRGQAIPQMILLTPNVPVDAIPKEIVCKNIGWDGLNVHWDCSADMKNEWSLDNPIISCEGWSGPGDDYVVPGSCSISYELKYTPSNINNSGNQTKYKNQNQQESQKKSEFFREPYGGTGRGYARESYEYVKSNKYYGKQYDRIDNLIGDVFETGFYVFCIIMIIVIIGIAKLCKSRPKNKDKKKEKFPRK